MPFRWEKCRRAESGGGSLVEIGQGFRVWNLGVGAWDSKFRVVGGLGFRV